MNNGVLSVLQISAMENDDLGPIGVRDYPPGCVPAPRRNSISRGGASRGGSAEVDLVVIERSRVVLPAGFSSWDAREQFFERRRIYKVLREHYERLKARGENIARPDLKAMKQMNDEGLSFKFEESGDVPGVIVGDRFDYRSEMYVVGLHRQTQAGIVYVDYGADKIATSVVASGGYEDDRDYGEVLHYSGQGGNDYRGEKRQQEDQTRSIANEALVRSFQLRIPVRVNRGHDVETTKGWNKIYSYDGLYDVYNATTEMGASGYKVYKFELRRRSNQPPLQNGTVRFNGFTR
ncbi:hypothetical protein M758_5G117100 [Ceratodon purpureus]|nr:hypothetical protein M758_5G117100 [Ceratodon purpureus]